MRNLLFCLPFLLVACGDDGVDFVPSGTDPEPLPLVQHVPEITALSLSPQTANFMEGDGSVTVTAELVVTDSGLDVQTLFVLLPQGTTLEFAEVVTTATGEITEQFAMSTEAIDVFVVEFWIEDAAGNRSTHESVEFTVVADVQTSAWTQRLSGLPYALNDVVWNGQVFVAVGDGGTVLTSADGIEWGERETFIDVNLNAVDAHASGIVAVGEDETVLLSTDNGVSWSVKRSNANTSVRLAAVTINSSQIVAGGINYGLPGQVIMLSEDLGESWVYVTSWPPPFRTVTDLIFRDGLFVASVDPLTSTADTRVTVSIDAESWTDVVLREEIAATYALVHDGRQFFAAGSQSTVFTSIDGYYWTELATPIGEVDYLSAAWNGSKLVVAGGITWWYWWGGVIPPFERPVGLSSTDGGETWEIFNIDGFYESRGMAWGNGRFVSVGQSTPISASGAIYTSD